MEQPLDLGVCLGKGWQSFTQNAVALIVGCLLACLVSGITLGICTGPMMVGYAGMCVRAARGETVQPGDVMAGFQKFGTSFVLFLLMGIAIGIGSILVIPGIVLGFLFCWAPYLVAEGETDPIAALRGSWDYTLKNFGAVFVFVLVQGVVASIGSLGAGLGALVTGPVAAEMMAHGYLRAMQTGSEAVVTV